MKIPAKKKATKKPVATKIKEELLTNLTGEQLKAVEDFTGTQITKKKYSATITMGGLSSTAQGNDETIFSGLSLPKVTYKCHLVVENNDNHKVFETTLAPFMAKKVLINQYVQKFQWKRIAEKLA